ncbi:hypothetical protein BASA82_001006 [Batrachochytrium salamandrivorans]|nr:hypothetical protein BASA82_001006 [Batrachochytrium salamandrivorans]KAH9273724.1 hypothetical protein BASA83_004058 [Batrachochytrium salamandrivorans]
MRLISFAMVSLLAITVSAQPPHNTDTDAMDQSQNVDIQEIGQLRGASPENVQVLLNFLAQNSQQSQYAATQSTQQPQDISIQDVQDFLDDATQNVQQSPDVATQNMDQFQGISDQEIDAFLSRFSQDPQQSPESDIQMSDQSQDAIAQISQYLQNSDTQSTEPSHGISAQNVHQSPDAATQSTQQPQDISIQDVQDFLDDAAQNVQQSPDAATQSAHSSQDSGVQNMDQFQGISDQEVDEFLDAAQSADQSEKKRLHNEVDRLTKARKRHNDRCFEIDSQIRADKRRDMEVRGMIDRTFIKLQATDISDDERLRLQQKSYELKMMLDELVVRHKENHQSYTDATAKRRDANAALHLFRDNQSLMAVYNYQNGAQVGFSPNSCYNMEILKTQYDRVRRDIDALFAEQAKLRSAISVSDDGALKTQSAQIADRIQDLQSYSGAAGDILWQHENGQPINTWISKLLDPYIENDKIE